MDYEALAKQFGGTLVKPSETTRVEVSLGGVPIYAESAGASAITPPAGYQLLSMSLVDAKPAGSYYDETVNAWFAPTAPATAASPAAETVDLTELAAQYGGTIVQPEAASTVGGVLASPEEMAELEKETTATGLAGAATRGFALPAAGAALGAALGAPLAGVGAIPGAIAGAGAATLAGFVADPVVGAVNSLLGTKYTLPTDALQDLLTRVGVAEPRTAAERIMQTTAAGAGGGAGMAAAGKGIATAADAALDLGRIMASKQGIPYVAGEVAPVVRGVGQMLATAPVLQAASGGTAAGAGEVARESGAGPVGQIGATLAGALVPFAPQAVRNVAQAVAPQGASIAAKPQPTVRESVQSIASTAKAKIAPESQAQIVKQLVEDPGSTDVVRFMMAGTQAVPDNLAANALKQGWKEGAVASIKAASDKDRSAMRKMLNIFKMGDKNEKFRAMNRPADILGDTVESRIKFLAESNKDAGKAINRIAETQLKGQRVDFDPAINKFIDDLGQIGVKVEMDQNGLAKAVLEGSQIEGDEAAQRILNVVLKRLSKTATPDALGIHNAKQFIDTQVSYGKQTLNPLTSKAERTLKDLRRNLNQVLGDSFPEYKAANTRYSETKATLDMLQDAAGTKINFESPNASKALGTAMRKLTSNYGTRANLIDALDQANQISTKYGMKIDDDIVNQLIFVNELDRMFGAAAQTSLKGQQSEALATGVDLARGRIAGRAFDLLTEKAEELRGINKENAIKSMEEILKRTQP
jgi:hypothetical protein